MSKDVLLRPAVEADAPGIAALLHYYAVDGILLDRNEEDILFYLHNFTVAVDENDNILGCMAVRDFGNDLLEVRSLAIQPGLRRGGIGRKLLEKAISRLDEERGNYRLFALTLQPGFFEHLKFSVVDKELFPEKIWADCSRCPKRDCCDETAVIYNGRSS